MAYSNPGAQEDLYDDGPSQKTEEPGETGEQEQEEHKDEETALLPKTILAGKTFNPGDELVLEVVRLLDDQVEVKYASEKGEKEDESPDEGQPKQAGPSPGGGESEMESMMY